jgi:hypothetical protein
MPWLLPLPFLYFLSDENLMMKDEVPAAIEGLQILVCGLAIKPSGRPLKLHPTLLVFQFDVQRGGDGTIEREASPKEARFRAYSLLNEGDEISGPHLWGFSSSPIKPDNINVGQSGRSHRHSGQDITCRGVCFLEIIRGWRGAALLAHPRQELLSQSDI